MEFDAATWTSSRRALERVSSRAPCACGRSMLSTRPTSSRTEIRARFDELLEEYRDADGFECPSPSSSLPGRERDDRDRPRAARRPGRVGSSRRRRSPAPRRRWRELVRESCEELGLRVQWQQVEDGRANVLGTLAGRGRRADADVQRPPGHVVLGPRAVARRHPRLPARAGFERDGRIYGLGISNMKGALACYVEACGRCATRASGCAAT